MDISVATFHHWRQQLLPLHNLLHAGLKKWGEEWNRGRSLNMSEEAKEKASSGKATHRKKKGKKVWERKLSLFLLNCCLGWGKSVLCACMWSEGFFDKERIMGEADEFLIKCLILVSRFIDFFLLLLLLVNHLSRWSRAHFRCVLLSWLLVYVI